MVERPLLLFPGKAEVSRSNKSGGPTSHHLPGHARQGQRLNPKFTQLQNVLRQRAVEFQQSSDGIEPEQALVLETIGSVEDFMNAVKKIDGFEWLGETEIDEIIPDEDFYDSQFRDKPLNGRLYAVMSNARAVDELLSMWNRWLADNAVKFDRGLNKFKDVFARLKDIRRWSVEDRLGESGILEAWQEDLQHYGDRVVRFEIELWFRTSPEKRLQSATVVRNLVSQLNGSVSHECVISEIAYHALLAELPANAIQQIIANPHTTLVECDGVMFFRRLGQISSDPLPSETELIEANIANFPLPSGNPVVALLDGLPVSNHAFLSGRIIIDDPDNWLSEYRLDELKHGTAMASLIVHGDLSSNEPPLKRPVYVRPIMKPNPNDFNQSRSESVPDNGIAVDLVHRAVRRIFEGDGTEAAAAPSVKAINLSVCDLKRHFNASMSPWARLLDWLSVKYNVLFIVSAGNHNGQIGLQISDGETLAALTAEELRKRTVKSLYENSRHRKILSPAESINCLTIGAAHSDACVDFTPHNRLNLFDAVMPSPYSPFGAGYRKSIKPDFLYHGGRQLYGQVVNSRDAVAPTRTIQAPGNKVAYPGTQVGELNRTIYCCGTSNAAALVTRSVAVCFDTLEKILSATDNADYQNYEIPLLKAMLVHGCSWGEIENLIMNSLETESTRREQVQKLVSRWLGYGIPNIGRVLECTEQRATVLGFGHLSNDEAHVFDLPLPPSLESKVEWRRVTVTMAYNSPINPTNQKYRQASLWFELLDNNLVTNRSDAQWQAVKRGTVQHEVFIGDRAVSYPDGGALKIKVNCTKDAGKIEYPIPYGLVVSLEVGEGVQIPVYQEIKSKIAPMVQIGQTSGSRLGG
jgi:hypothetical protein